MYRLLSKKSFIFLFVTLAFGSVVMSNDLVAVANEEVIGERVKFVVGTVHLDEETPIHNARVVAHRIDQYDTVETLTNAAGQYELSVMNGLWAVTVEPTADSVPGNWIYPHEPRQVAFNHDMNPETHAIDFVVSPTGGVVFGNITLPNGSPPPFVVTISFRNSEGIGKEVTTAPGDGTFRVRLPHGRYDVNIHPHHDGFAGPMLEPIHLQPNEVLDLGNIPLLARDAMISGKVVDENGVSLSGIPVAAWHNGRPAALITETEPDGTYRLSVVSGTWHIQPAPTADMPYLYLGEPEVVRVAPGEHKEHIDFELLTADATLKGVLVNGKNEVVADVAGWAAAVHTSNERIRSGAPIREGQFAIKVPGGEYLISVYLPPGSKYVVISEPIVAVEPGETAHVRILVEERDTKIAGALIDPRQDRHPITGIPGIVAAWSGEQWVSTHIRPDLGTYSLDVSAGIWRLDYSVAHEDYVKLGRPRNIPVPSGQKVVVNLPVTQKDAGIAGQVFAPDGSPLPGAVVIVNGLTGDVRGLRLRTQADENGRYRLALPHGRYLVGARGGQPGWINPLEPIVSIEPNSVAENIDLHFHEPDAQIRGSLTVLHSQFEGEALVWAWSPRGGFTKGHFPVEPADDNTAVGAYRLGVLSGSVWHVGAVFETEDAYWFGHGVVRVPADGAKLNLTLSGPFPKPAPRVVVFDASQSQRILLADGTTIFIPAGAMPVEGRVTLRIVPIATLPHQHHARVIKYGYTFFASDSAGRPIEEKFNHDVLIRFHYDKHLFSSHTDQLKPAYFSTTTNEWTFPNRFVVNTERQVVIMAIDHFTEFALVENVNGSDIFVPVIR